MTGGQKIGRTRGEGTRASFRANYTLYLRAGFSVLLFGMAAFYFVSSDWRVDEQLLYLLTGAVVVGLVPLENVGKLKVGPVEMEMGKVEAAIEQTATGQHFDDRALKGYLSAFSPEALAHVAGGRILWIDDWPQTVAGPRRILRALQLEIITAISSSQALEILLDDPDIDLIITDVQRLGDSYEYLEGNKFTDGDRTTWFRVHEGVNFVVRLHNDEHAFDSIPQREVRELTMRFVRQIPIVFYAAYPRADLERYTLPARLHVSDRRIGICNTVHELVQKVILRLIEVRTRDISYPTDKIPTSLRKLPDGRSR